MAINFKKMFRILKRKLDKIFKKEALLRIFVFYLLIGSMLLYFEYKVSIKEKKYIRLIEVKFCPFEWVDANIYNYEDYYNHFYINKFFDSFNQLDEFYLYDCKAWMFKINFKTYLTGFQVVWIIFGFFYIFSYFQFQN
jgi:hypothetical protein